MRIVLNADDFGASNETLEATLECFKRGALTSASIMPNMPATPRALAFAASNPEFSFGVHLTLTGDGPERPLSPPEKVPGLVRSDGSFRGTRELRARALLGRLAVAEIETEISAQIRALREHGLDISHVDSHRHLHKLGPFRTALRTVLPRFRITRVRTVQDVYLARAFTSATYWLAPVWRRRLVEGFTTTDHFYMPASAGDVAWEQPLLALAKRLPGPSFEIGVHPGHEGWRDEERRSVLSFADGARRQGHELVPWTAIGQPAAARG